MAPGDAARLYHALTSYSPDREWDVPGDDPRLRHDLVPNDPDTLPQPVKSYADGPPTLPLPRRLPGSALPATEVLAGARPADLAPLDLGYLGRLLFLSAGVTRVAERHGRRVLFRAAGSAGARFPLEVYVAARGVAGLTDGVHWYDPVGHGLVQVGPAPAGTATSVVVTGVPWRTGWRYAERGYRHLGWDAGTLLSQQIALAHSVGWRPRLHARFPDAAVAALVGADGVHEFPLAVLALADGEPAVIPSATAIPGQVDAAPQEFPLVTATHRAGEGNRLGPPWPEPAAVDGDDRDGDGASPLDEVILRRGSTRRMDRTGALPEPVLTRSLAAATRGIAHPQYVAAHGVRGLDPGLYRWTDGAPELLRAGTFRDEVQRVALDQALAGDAAYVVVSCVDLDRVDDRGYLEAQLAAGLVEGRLHLEAYARGAGASGMTFLDSEIHSLLGAPLAAALFTCVGIPEYTSRTGGAPREPVPVRIVPPR